MKQAVKTISLVDFFGGEIGLEMVDVLCFRGHQHAFRMLMMASVLPGARAVA